MIVNLVSHSSSIPLRRAETNTAPGVEEEKTQIQINYILETKEMSALSAFFIFLSFSICIIHKLDVIYLIIGEKICKTIEYCEPRSS